MTASPAERFDIVVIGGGIAGISAAHHLAARHRTVLVIDQERSLTHHTTGRSAALFFGSYGHADIVPLSSASRPFLDQPPPELTDLPLLHPRGALTVVTPEQTEHGHLLDEETPGVVSLEAHEVERLVPVLRPVLGGRYEAGAADIDVAELHQCFVRGFRRGGGEIRTRWKFLRAEYGDDGWLVGTNQGNLRCDVVVDAAGAWGDEVALGAGVRPIGLEPRRRTAFMVMGPDGCDRWPLVTDVTMSFYFKPDGPQLLCSPADETASEPCDARPDPVDIALAIERINAVTHLEIRSIRSSWAGLRTFCPGGSMAIGSDADVPSFFWLVGQGGTGIQTAPAAGRLTADLIVDGEPSPELGDHGVDAAALDPRRSRPD